MAKRKRPDSTSRTAPPRSLLDLDEWDGEETLTDGRPVVEYWGNRVARAAVELLARNNSALDFASPSGFRAALVEKTEPSNVIAGIEVLDETGRVGQTGVDDRLRNWWVDKMRKDARDAISRSPGLAFIVLCRVPDDAPLATLHEIEDRLRPAICAFVSNVDENATVVESPRKAPGHYETTMAMVAERLDGFELRASDNTGWLVGRGRRVRLGPQQLKLLEVLVRSDSGWVEPETLMSALGLRCDYKGDRRNNLRQRIDSLNKKFRKDRLSLEIKECDGRRRLVGSRIRIAQKTP